MCCGASRAVGLRPQQAFLLGEDDGSPPRYVRVNDSELFPGVGSPNQIYVKGTLVQQAIDEGKIEDVGSIAVRKRGKTIFRVTLPDGSTHDFTAYATARSYSVRNGGKITVVQEDNDG